MRTPTEPVQQNNGISRSLAVDICRLGFIVLVALVHFESLYFSTTEKIFTGGYLGADFFFIVSGFLLYHSWKSGKYRNALDYTFKRYLNFLPYAAIMWICFFCMEMYRYTAVLHAESAEIQALVHQRLLYSLKDLTFLQLFIHGRTYNNPLWFISVLLVVGLTLYFYLDIRKKSHPVVILIVSLLLFAYLNAYNGTLDIHTASISLLNIPGGILRGLAGMGMGLFCAELLDEWLQANDGQILPVFKGSRFIWAVLNWLILMPMLACIFFKPHSSFDSVFIVCAAAFVTLAFTRSTSALQNPKSSLNRQGSAESQPPNNRVWITSLSSVLSRLSFSIYMCHSFVAGLWNYVRKPLGVPLGEKALAIRVYMLMTLLAAILLEFIVWMIKLPITRRKTL